MKRILFFLSIIFLINSVASSFEKTIILGSEDNWVSINEHSNLIFTPGRGGYIDITLKDGQYFTEDSTDLLLHFNSNQIIEETGNYTLNTPTAAITTGNAVLGSGAAVFYRDAPGIVLIPKANSLFSSGREWIDFTIEFWLYPANLNTGETVFLWKGYREISESIVSQEIRCYISDRKLYWKFKNLFLPPYREQFSLELNGETSLIPRKWYHHTLRFRSDTGLLEYLIDGKPEAITYANSSGREGNSIYTPAIGTSAEGFPIIGESLTGFIDEFRISDKFIDTPFIEKYSESSGSASTAVIDMRYPDSRPIRIDAEYNTPGKTDIDFSYKAGNDILYTGDIPGEWIPFIPGITFDPTTSFRYIQFKIELYPDSFDGLSPSVSNISLTYIPALPLQPPSGLTIVPGDKKGVLSWQKSEDDNIKGYMVYYGDSPGYYFGNGLSSGKSPIDAGKNTELIINNLENGKLYYFAVVSYNRASPPDISIFSNEVSCRPSGIFGTD